MTLSNRAVVRLPAVNLFPLLGFFLAVTFGLGVSLYIDLVKHPLMDIYILLVVLLMLAAMSLTLKQASRQFAISFAALPLLAFYLRPASISNLHMMDVPL